MVEKVLKRRKGQIFPLQRKRRCKHQCIEPIGDLHYRCLNKSCHRRGEILKKRNSYEQPKNSTKKMFIYEYVGLYPESGESTDEE